MDEPYDIAFGKDGFYAVADNSNDCVWIFDGQDQFVSKFGNKGTSSGQFSNPHGVAFDDSNHLYVTDCSNHRIQKFDINGKHLLTFGSNGSGNSQLSSPVGITVHNSKVYIVENGNNRISAFHCDGQFSHIIGSGLLNLPWYVTVSNDQLLVAKWSHNCISIFTLNGNYVGKYETQGTGNEQLKSPCGIATDTHAHAWLYLCD